MGTNGTADERFNVHRRLRRHNPIELALHAIFKVNANVIADNRVNVLEAWHQRGCALVPRCVAARLVPRHLAAPRPAIEHARAQAHAVSVSLLKLSVRRDSAYIVKIAIARYGFALYVVSAGFQHLYAFVEHRQMPAVVQDHCLCALDKRGVLCHVAHLQAMCARWGRIYL
jgi:hypothetical protein